MDAQPTGAAPKFWLIETSQQPGLVALAEGDRIVAVAQLDDARRHARDLVPTTASLLEGAGWTVADLDAVVVGLGPGSYTGLRVGLTTAKTFAYARKIRLIGVPTFEAIAHGCGPDVAIFADAQQGKAYVQTFASGVPTGPVRIEPVDDWLATLASDGLLAGPGVDAFADRLAGRRVAPPETRGPTAISLATLGFARWRAGVSDDPFTLEPLYLRRSSAEENWKKG